MPSEIRDKNWGTRTRFIGLLRRQYGYDLQRRCSCVIHEGGVRQILEGRSYVVAYRGTRLADGALL
jgi:hypothetical protein